MEHALGHQLTDEIKNLDVPLDYRFGVSIEQIEHFDEHGRLLHVHPGAPARALDAEARVAILGPLVSEVTTKLEVGSRDVRAYRDPPGLNVRVAVEVAGATESRSILPGRLGDISPPPAGGYAPDVMAEHLVRRKIGAKLKKGQGPATGLPSVLVVDLIGSELSSELEDPGDRAGFERAMSRPSGRGFAATTSSRSATPEAGGAR